MKPASASSYRLVALIFIAVCLLGIIGIAMNGWQTAASPELPDVSTQAANSVVQEPRDTHTATPEFTQYLTGLATTKEDAATVPVAFVTDSSLPMYGISRSLITVEFPTENGKTRYLFYTNQAKELGKIGSLAPSRLYISDIAHVFGGVQICAGFDDSVSYEGDDPQGFTLDVVSQSGYAYTENLSQYTYGYLVGKGLENAGFATTSVVTPSLPFAFAEYGTNAAAGTMQAKSVVIPYADGNQTQLSYREAEGVYVLSKSALPQTDLLDDEPIVFDNAFILFADAVTYEKADGTETILDVHSGGAGYYISAGTLTRITWSFDADGLMRMTDSAGQLLTVNRGKSYFGFCKVSQKNTIRFW